MKCPKCNHDQVNSYECESCGIIFEKYAKRQKQLENSSNQTASLSSSRPTDRKRSLYILLTVVIAGCLSFIFFLSSPDSEDPVKIPADAVPETSAAEPVHLENDKQDIAKQIHDAFPPRNTIEEARNATVFIKTAWSIGSGFFIDNSCNVITNRHVIEFDENEMTDLRRKMSALEQYIAYETAAFENIEKRMSRIPGDPPRSFKDALKKKEDNLKKAKEDYERITSQLDDIEYGFAGSEYAVILIDGTEFKGTGPITSEEHDLALLKVPYKGCPYIRTGQADNLIHGEKVYTIGNPEGMMYSVTSGIFSGYRKLQGNRYIQTDAPINPGNSGGPMINDKGRAIGVNTLVHATAQNIGFAIPIETVLSEFKDTIEP